MSRRAWRALGRSLLIVLAVVLAAGGSWFAYPRLVAPALLVTELVEGPVVQAFYATGTLLPDHEYPVRSSVDGFVAPLADAPRWAATRLAAVDKGTLVHQGQPVAFIRVREYQLQYEQALADLQLKKKLADPATSPTLRQFDDEIRASQEQLDIANRDYKRVTDLLNRQAASEADFDRAAERVQDFWKQVASLKAQRATRQAELERDVAVAQAALGIAQWNLDQQTVKAPIDGVVLDWPVTLGTHVRVNELLMTIADVRPARLVMRANVDEENKTELWLGQDVTMTLYAYEGRVFHGKVERIYPMADADRRTFEVDVAVRPVDAGFSAGMTGELAFEVARQAKAIVLPTQAVRMTGRLHAPAADLVSTTPAPGGDRPTPQAAGTVWIVRDGRLQACPVTVGLRSITRTQIISGLPAGARVVVSPVQGLEAGQRVTTRYLDPDTAAGLNKPAPETVQKFK